MDWGYDSLISKGIIGRRLISRPTLISRRMVLSIGTVEPEKMVWDNWENGCG